MLRAKLFRTEICCSKCGNIQTIQLQGHQKGVNYEIGTWCYKCKIGTIHILMGDKDLYLIKLNNKIENHCKLNNQENMIAKVLKRK